MPQQWQPALAPTYRRRANVKIVIAGMDITDAMAPYLISVQVLLKDWGPDTANIELDDRNAELPIPRDDEPVKIYMGWAGSGPSLPLNQHVERIYKLIIPDQYVDGSPIKEVPYQASGYQMVFGGIVKSVESGFARAGGGRRLWVECISYNEKGDAKAPSLMTVGQGDSPDGDGQDVSLKDFLGNVMQKNGLTLYAYGVDDIKRKFWIQDNESPMSLGQRIATELGLSFKIIGNSALIGPREQLPNGDLAPTVEAVWGVNLISWRIKPFSGRPQWAGAKQRFFDIWNGMWKSVTKSIGGSVPFGSATAVAMMHGAAPNEQAGQQYNEGMAADSQESRGTGWVIINGEPAAQPNGNVVISGARPGVDGRYAISEAEHNYTRGGGYTTRCNLKRPQLISDDYWSWSSKTPEQMVKQQLRDFPSELWGDMTPVEPQFPPEVSNPPTSP
ncbi:hypothetical protein [Bradyrhizobium sp. Leo121]|uniref:phage late control D family protein n=1 Tax=Bradyrhizobium sp. Leo121 TaxID=1571195 RepID=UPI001028F93F|nr:hypothetical protein [Bradyrhizobium sp. Leo121]RZN13905.1 hypothetical protein CWO90_43950 [Bradyrhizobium sp. Leo121]